MKQVKDSNRKPIPSEDRSIKDRVVYRSLKKYPVLLTRCSTRKEHPIQLRFVDAQDVQQNCLVSIHASFEIRFFQYNFYLNRKEVSGDDNFEITHSQAFDDY